MQLILDTSGKERPVYYERPGVAVYCDRAESIMPRIPDNSVDLIATDPPYHHVKDIAWDREHDTPDAFLAWLGAVCVEWRRVLKPNGSLYVFASPDMATRVESLVREHFNVLNSIRWQKDEGWHKKADKEELRSYLSNWEAIIFAEQYGDGVPNVVSPFAQYLRSERERAGLTVKQLSEHFPSRTGGLTGCVWNWENGANLPTAEQYTVLRGVLNTSGKRNGHAPEYLRQDYEELRRPFNVTKDVPYTDVWDFATVPAYPGKHPCEKPVPLWEHIIRTSSRPGALVLDTFMGTGSCGEACIRQGRNFLGVDASARYCEQAIGRLGQPTLFALDA